MNFTTVLAALTFLGQLGVTAAKPVPATSPGSLSLSFSLQRRSPTDGESEEPKVTWTYEPQFDVPRLKELWEGAACTAAHTKGCKEAYITGGPFHGDEQEWKRRGRYIFISTEKHKNLRVFVNGSIADPKSPRPAPSRSPRAAWADSSDHENLSPTSREKWEKTVCQLTGRMGCKERTIISGPHDGEDAVNLARHGQHVHVKTDKHNDLQVYADGTGRIRGP